LFVIIGSDSESLEESSVTFSGSIFFRWFIEGVSGAGPDIGTVGIDPMMICGIKFIGVVNVEDAEA